MSYRLRLSRPRLPSSAPASTTRQLPLCPYQCRSYSPRPPTSDADTITEETPAGVLVRPASKNKLNILRPRPSLYALEKPKRSRSALKTDYSPPPAPTPVPSPPSEPPIIWHTMTSYRLHKKHERDNALYFRIIENLRWRLIGNRSANLTVLEKQFRSKVIVGRKGGLMGNQGIKIMEAVPGGGMRERMWVYGSILDGDREGAFEEMRKLVGEKYSLVRVDREEYVAKHELRPRNQTPAADIKATSEPGKERIENGISADFVDNQKEEVMDWMQVYERRKKAEAEGKISPDAPKIILDMGLTDGVGGGPKTLRVPKLKDVPAEASKSGKLPPLGRTSYIQYDELADDEFGRGGGYL